MHGMAATAVPPLKARPNRVVLLEQVMFTRPLKVDRQAGIIYGVKAQGKVSRNGYPYTDEAIRGAVRKRLFESAKVYIGHPPREDPRRERDFDAAFGRLFEVHEKPDGIYANLKFNVDHPKARQVCNDAEQGIGNFGLSLNGDGDKRAGPDGKMQVYEILEVRSVDIVTRPATTVSLSESEGDHRMKTTPLQLLESLSLRADVPRPRRKLIMEAADALAAEPAMNASMDVPDVTGDGTVDHNDHLAQGFKAALAALVAEDMPEKDLIKRLKEIIRAKGMLLGGDAGGADGADGGDGGGADDLAESLTVQTRRADAYKLLMEAEITNPPAFLLESLPLMESEEKQRKAINSYKVSQQGTPRSQGARKPVEPAGGGNGKTEAWVTK
jgi:hypothetical protein